MLLGDGVDDMEAAVAIIIGFVVLAGLLLHVVRNYIYRRLDE